ncbi:MAG: carboxypeptidase-like regulatory domain-containing protein, partial [Chitinophaga rupis]
MYHKMIIGWCLLLAVISGFGQTPDVTGTVLDDYGHPLAGVSVSVKGGKAVSFTNADGEFHIDAAAGSVLVIEHPRFDVREWKVKGGEKPLFALAARPLQERHGRDVPSGDTIRLSSMRPQQLDVLYGQEDVNRF